jgi:hypothetical protein
MLKQLYGKHLCVDEIRSILSLLVVREEVAVFCTPWMNPGHLLRVL